MSYGGIVLLGFRIGWTRSTLCTIIISCFPAITNRTDERFYSYCRWILVKGDCSEVEQKLKTSSSPPYTVGTSVLGPPHVPRNFPNYQTTIPSWRHTVMIITIFYLAHVDLGYPSSIIGRLPADTCVPLETFGGNRPRMNPHWFSFSPSYHLFLL